MNSSYISLVEAILDLKNRGFTIDYNLELSKADGSELLNSKGYVIIEVHRFEGQTSSDDESVVYALQSPDGKKGFLVNGYGISSDPRNDAFLSGMKTAY